MQTKTGKAKVVLVSGEHVDIVNVIAAEWMTDNVLEIRSLQDVRDGTGQVIVAQGFNRETIAGYIINSPVDTAETSERVAKIAKRFSSPQQAVCGSEHPKFDAVTCVLTAGHNGEHQSRVPRFEWEAK
jgi:hypothetical protein